MPALISAVVVIGLVGVCNLVVMLLIIRRLRAMGGGAHGQSHDLSHDQSHEDSHDVMTPPGDVAGDFAARATTGEEVSRADLSGLTLVGFFSASCVACKEKLPEFVARAGRMPGGRAQVLASVNGSSEVARAMVTELEAVGRVVEESDPNPIFAAFMVRSFPAFCLIDETGRIVAKAGDVRQLPLPVAA